jgi:hypothetical protein
LCAWRRADLAWLRLRIAGEACHPVLGCRVPFLDLRKSPSTAPESCYQQFNHSTINHLEGLLRVTHEPKEPCSFMARRCHRHCIVMRIKFGEQSPGWRLVGVGHSPPCICDPSLQLLQTSLAERKPTFAGKVSSRLGGLTEGDILGTRSRHVVCILWLTLSPYLKFLK